MDPGVARAVPSTHQRLQQPERQRGHLAGDKVLLTVADLLKSTVRGCDIVARYGGDEFVIVLPGTDADRTAMVAGRIVEGARSLSIDTENGEKINITLSLGTATQDGKHDFKSSAGLIRAADSALYESKRKGRDCYMSFDDAAVA